MIKLFVYTFWEPHDKIPYYLQLCMETWKKFLPNATIVVLDYKNLGDFIDVRELDSILSSDKITLPQIADVIRVLLLAKRGGVWLDIDTVILNAKAERYFFPDKKHRTVLFGNPARKNCNIAFINTPPSSMCMRYWREFIFERIWNMSSANFISWNFFGNTFIDDYVRYFPDEVKIFDQQLVMPELNQSAEDIALRYLNFYFLWNHRAADVKSDLLLLHNSWTPSFFSGVSSENFWHLDCTLVNILAEALEIKLPPERNRVRIIAEKQSQS